MTPIMRAIGGVSIHSRRLSREIPMRDIAQAIDNEFQSTPGG